MRRVSEADVAVLEIGESVRVSMVGEVDKGCRRREGGGEEEPADLGYRVRWSFAQNTEPDLPGTL